MEIIQKYDQLKGTDVLQQIAWCALNVFLFVNLPPFFLFWSTTQTVFNNFLLPLNFGVSRLRSVV
jgi:hypothetical protein